MIHVTVTRKWFSYKYAVYMDHTIVVSMNSLEYIINQLKKDHKASHIVVRFDATTFCYYVNHNGEWSDGMLVKI